MSRKNLTTPIKFVIHVSILIAHYCVMFIQLKKGITVYFFPTSNMTRQSTEILLNVTTPQDLLVEMGPPLRTFYKEDDQMRIHSEENGKSADYGNHMTNAVATDAALPPGEGKT